MNLNQNQKKYLVAIKGGEIFSFPTAASRGSFLSGVANQFPGVQYATSETEGV